ncbi:MAG: fibronectin type III domain-containing protein [Cyclobacteriaceae bacterium]|nr:fibronectin type III domain-containing protein [Cyclobacteriaceae bacterium]
MKKVKTIKILINCLAVVLLFSFDYVSAQIDTIQNQIKVLARPSLDSIVLRWAPVNVDAWIKGSRDGYEVDRYTLVRDGKIVNPPEKKQLAGLMKPWPEEQWERLVNQNKYAAIAAQALFGSEFELTTEGTDVFQIVNKVQENEMRFSFALYAADLSVPVSLALGLRFTDKDVRQGEKYLYRVLSIHEGDTIYGSVFQGPEEYVLPAPMDFIAEFEGSIVSLKWDQSYHRGIYTAYVVERSADGGRFMPITEDAMVTLSNEDQPESRYQYATDSLPDGNKEYAYRVRGLTPFGEIGPPTEPVSGISTATITDVPYIRSDESPDNTVINLNWEFPAVSESGLKGFEVRRSSSPKDRPITINKEIIASALRTFQDEAPEKNNYYQVVAIALSGEEFKSPIHLVQLIDSIPPLAPVGMSGKVDERGRVSFSWKPNEELDMYGYRIYRSNNPNAEFSQVTIEPIANNSFVDSINLKTLDRHIYYQVMAIDKSQNHSKLSEVLALEIPDQVPPVSPVFLPVTSNKEVVELQWLPSSSDDVKSYDIYLQKPGEQEWRKLNSVPRTKDSIISYKVTNLEEGLRVNFTVLAVDQSGLESTPATPVSAARLISAVKPPVQIAEPEIDRTAKNIRLKWNYEQNGVYKYQIYRAKENDTIRLYKTIEGTTNDFNDKELVMNSVYTYQVVAVFSSGARSAFSEKIIVNY